MSLSLQEKLALAMSSAGSQRLLASALGISHQRLGRWLREGEEGGVREIPPEAAPLINQVFGMHAQVTREQSKIDDLPFDKNAPVFTQRMPLRDGTPGDRAISFSTEFIRSDLRQRIMVGAQQSQKYYQASVKSVVDFQKYAWDRALELMVAQLQRQYTIDTRAAVSYIMSNEKKQLNKKARAINRNFEDEERERGRIVDTSIPFELYTQYENISPQVNRRPHKAAANIETKLRQKHEPATGGKGTLLANQFLFQLIPAKNEQDPTSRARNKRGTRGRGNK